MTLFPGTATWGPPGDETSPHRYTLTRTWDRALPTFIALMINPSTATAEKPDPTITRCIGFARDSGHGSLTVLNAFAYRTPFVSELVAAHRRGVDIVGPQNDGAILVECLQPRTTVVVAWGPPRKVPQVLRPRFDELLFVLRNHDVLLHTLALTEDGHPRHPLMLRSDCRPTPWDP